MPRVGIALGSNLGDRLAHLHAAFDCLREIALVNEPFLGAAIYQTEPMLCPPGSPLFYNSVAEIGFDGTPSGLLEITRSIEIKIGRSPTHIRNAPRIIDVDLLYFGNQHIATDTLVLPHPRLSERRFVLQPLAEIRPRLVLPGYRQSISDLLEQLHSEEPPLVRVAPAF
jgi:2-amino-4-hydroxy-6-hydroxymethyldihydropteridine diphosphokinase